MISPPPKLVRKIRKPRLAPPVADHLLADVPLGVEDPSNHVATSSLGDGRVGILDHQTVHVLVLHLRLEGLVIADVDGLDKPGAAGWKKVDLNAKFLDLVDDGPHHVHGEGVKEQEGDDSWGGSRNVRREDLIDPLQHDVLQEPCLWLNLVGCIGGKGGELALFDYASPFPCGQRKKTHRESWKR
jgi:hypothetical protein